MLVLLVACSTTDEIPTLSASTYFEQAMEALADNDALTAREKLRLLGSQHPFSPYAHQALLELAHIDFTSGDNISAQATLDRFLRLHASSEHTDYAYYLRGMIKFAQDRSFLQNYTSINPALRDLTHSRSAYQDFSTLIRHYPLSQFAQDSRAHMAYIRELFAQKEVSIGEQYLQREAWVAAVNRSNYVLEHYVDTSGAVANALDIMISAYQAMDMDEQVQKAQQLLAANFPDYQSKYRFAQ